MLPGLPGERDANDLSLSEQLRAGAARLRLEHSVRHGASGKAMQSREQTWDPGSRA